MTAIFEEVTLQWEGKEYSVTPNYRMVQRIEQKVSIAGIAAEAAMQRPKFTSIAFVVFVLLQEAGVKDCDEEDIYAHLMTTEDPAEKIALFNLIYTAFTPKKKEKKLPQETVTG